MAKELRCGDLMPGCPEVIEGKDEEELLAKAAEHARQDHNVTSVTPELAGQIKAAIRER